MSMYTLLYMRHGAVYDSYSGIQSTNIETMVHVAEVLSGASRRMYRYEDDARRYFPERLDNLSLYGMGHGDYLQEGITG